MTSGRWLKGGSDDLDLTGEGKLYGDEEVI